ncbi:hypothetical protein Aspvir_003446 [Aspergillus viridinutans]|uniref:Uncharacterized protein n=1 Tax=Aspergillus viridinutans TaxID=75553 RepID=A0A9P3C475_ASPVI|nr:uncharacterized protein Aspvir_003446 [Aspergillus viridinutans]GIK07778.1 hypothetical protein Aspvir_003446 [Aspergillus viridinutans]
MSCAIVQVFEMPVRVNYDPACDRNFRRNYHDQFLQWINTTINGDIIDFDRALVFNGLHLTVGTYDPNPTPHAGPLATALEVQAAITTKFKTNGDNTIPAYEIRERLRAQSKRGTGVFVTPVASKYQQAQVI